MKIHWTGNYFDGVSAKRFEATVELNPHAIVIKVPGGDTHMWPHEEIRQAQGYYRGEPVRLERGEDPIEAVVVSEGGFLEALRRIADGHGARYHDPAVSRRRNAIVAGSAALSLAVIVFFYFIGIPWLAAVAAERVPPQWEAKLGEGVSNNITTFFDVCDDEAANGAVGEIVATLDAAAGDHPYTFDVKIVKSPIVNALAAPGGYIIIFSGLIERTDNPEELAGVVAHEMEHVLRKHSLKSMFKAFSTQMLFAAVFGDATVVSDTLGNLDSLRYSRDFEEEADTLGSKLLANAGVDPAGMVRFFEILKEEVGEGSESLKYFSSHPLTGERINTLTKANSARAGTYTPLLPHLDWAAVGEACADDSP